MPIIFRTKAAGEVILLAEHGKQILRIVGKDENAERGVITPQELPNAIAALQAEVKAQSPAPEDEGKPQRVGLAQRAWPVLEQWNAALKKNQPVTWGV